MYDRAENILRNIDDSDSVKTEQVFPNDPIYQMILDARIHDDARNNITTTFKKVGDDFILYRDASKCNPPDKGDFMNLATIGLTYCKALQTLLGVETGSDNANDEINNKAKEFYGKLVGLNYRYQSDPNASVIDYNEEAQKLLTDLVASLATDYIKEKHKRQISEGDFEPDEKIYKAAVKDLDKARHFVALEQKTFVVATKNRTLMPAVAVDSTGKDAQPYKDVLRVEVPMVDNDLISRYQFDKVPDPGKEPTNETPEWFTALDEKNQKLVQHYKSKLMKCDRIIPSQLRGVLPGLKNAYQQIIAISNDQAAEGEPPYEVLNASFHAGTIVDVHHKMVANKEMNTDLTHKTMVAQKEASGADHVHMVTLNAEYGDKVLSKKNKIENFFKKLKNIGKSEDKRQDITQYHGVDGDIVKFTRRAAQQDGSLHSSNICLNYFRRYFKNDYSGAFDLVKLVNNNFRAVMFGVGIPKGRHKDVIKLVTKGVNPYLKFDQEALITAFAGFRNVLIKNDSLSSKQKTTAEEQFWDQSSKLKNLCDEMCKEMRKLKLLTKDDKSRGTRILTLLNKISYENNKLAEMVNKYTPLGAPKLQTHSQWYGCASGENRTHFSAFNSQSDIIVDHFFDQAARISKRPLSAVINKEKQRQYRLFVRDQLSNAGHAGVMASGQGSTLGTFGLREKSKGSLSKDYSPDVVKKLVGSGSSEYKSWENAEKSRAKAKGEDRVVSIYARARATGLFESVKGGVEIGANSDKKETSKGVGGKKRFGTPLPATPGDKKETSKGVGGKNRFGTPLPPTPDDKKEASTGVGGKKRFGTPLPKTPDKKPEKEPVLKAESKGGAAAENQSLNTNGGSLKFQEKFNRILKSVNDTYSFKWDADNPLKCNISEMSAGDVETKLFEMEGTESGAIYKPTGDSGILAALKTIAESGDNPMIEVNGSDRDRMAVLKTFADNPELCRKITLVDQAFKNFNHSMQANAANAFKSIIEEHKSAPEKAREPAGLSVSRSITQQ